MRIYEPVDEEKLRLFMQAEAWRRNGLITEPQFREIEASTRTDLKRTTLMLRLLLFVFAGLLTAATVAFVFWMLELRNGGETVWLAISSALAYAAAERLAGSLRFYRHGAEEAFAAGALVLALLAAGYFIKHGLGLYGLEKELLLEILAAAGCFALYARFRHLYLALAGVLALAYIPFTFFDEALWQRAFLAAIFTLGLLLIRRDERAGPPVLLREEASFLFACLLFGLCLAVNLRLGDLRPWDIPHILKARAGVPAAAYWLSYLLTFLIPLAGLAAGLRTRRRALLIASAAGLILALCTNKDYLGFRHFPWDPAVLGALLIGISIALERRLKAEWNGYTSRQLLSPASHGLEAAALAAGAAGTPPAGTAAPGEGGASFGGGSSGGGGSSRSF
ncbi:MAG: hypothetical protein Q8O90_11295 [Elusimicrobiota bacterium]|nr:hypothetical protein [Elusimicrobiota bacterium]